MIQPIHMWAVKDWRGELLLNEFWAEEQNAIKNCEVRNGGRQTTKYTVVRVKVEEVE